jgi:hypothetical protein
MKIAYCPFQDEKTERLIERNISKFHAWTPFEKFDKNVRCHDGGATKVLADVKYSQQLYVFGHGRVKGGTISDCSKNRMTIKDLADQIFQDGLSISHEKVKLHSCWGGVGDEESNAAKLKEAMLALGYTKLTVYGYTEALKTSTSGVFGYKRGKSGARAKDIRVAF